MATQVISKNRMSASQLVISQNAELNIYPANANGNHAFQCGSVIGYCSAKAAQATDIKNLQYAECSIDGGQTYVPTLMVVGTIGKAPEKSFGKGLLH